MRYRNIKKSILEGYFMSGLSSFISVSRFLIILTFAGVINPVNLLAQGEKPVRLAIIGDRTGGHIPGIYSSIVKEIQLLHPELVITVGDMIEGFVDDTAVINDRWQEYFEVVKPLTMPLYYTPGNNDVYSDLSADWYRLHVAELYYSFNHQNLHFIIMDNSRVEKSEDIPPEQIEWLTEDLSAHSDAAFTFVFMHKPFWYETTAENKPDTLHRLFVKYGVDAVFCGHYHEYFTGIFDGIRYTTVGSSGGSTNPAPNGLEYHYLWVTIDRQGIHPAVINKGSVMPPDIITATELKTYKPLQRTGLVFPEPLPVENDLTVNTTSGKIILKNSSSPFPLEDTLRWDVPDNWIVTPEVMPIQVPARTDREITFTASVSGPLYPVPEIAVNFTYGKNKKVKVSVPISVARTAECFPVEGKVVIDGRLDESCWRQPVTELFSEEGPLRMTEPAAFYFAYDSDNLYLAARCHETRMDSLKAVVTERDGALHQEDCIGYFIEPHAGSDTVFQIYFNTLGTIYDYKIWKNTDGSTDYANWNGEYETKTAINRDNWSMEIRLPVKQLGLAGIAPGQKWEINFRRKQPRLAAAADWQLPIGYPAYRGGWLIMK